MPAYSPLSRRQLFAALAAVSALQATPKKGMRILSTRPEDFEMPMDGFSSWITPIEKFYVRSHHYTPTVNLAEWRLKIEGKVATPLTLTMDDLKKLPRVEQVSVMECAGNGRGLYEPSMPGLQWAYGSVGNARWAGVRLGDVLKRAGVQSGAIEVLFDGADVPVGKQPEFQRTIPLEKALNPNTLLAYEMNGAPIEPSHGFPLRLVAPAWASDSWVKWVTRIEVRDTEFDGFFMKTAYRYPGKGVRPLTAVDPAQMKPVTRLSIKSVIASVADGSDVPMRPLKIAGAAWSNESPVTAVEVSADGGRTWTAAHLGSDKAPFAWRLFEHTWMPPREAYYTLMARARNAAGETQPFAQEWNPSGYAHNVVHAVGVNVTANPRPAGEAPALPSVADAPAAYQQACLGCHTDEPVVQQRLSRGQWEKEVDKMQRWGAPVRPENRDLLIDFLSNRFGVRPRK